MKIKEPLAMDVSGLVSQKELHNIFYEMMQNGIH
jgi:hypothetical protein